MTENIEHIISGQKIAEANGKCPACGSPPLKETDDNFMGFAAVAIRAGEEMGHDICELCGMTLLGPESSSPFKGIPVNRLESIKLKMKERGLL